MERKPANVSVRIGLNRACYWSNWRLPRTRLKKLKALGVSDEEAYPFAHSGKGPWRLSMANELSVGVDISGYPIFRNLSFGMRRQVKKN